MSKLKIAMITAFITFIATVLLTYSMTQDLRKEVRALRAEHEVIEQNYCPTCGTYLGEVEE